MKPKKLLAWPSLVLAISCTNATPPESRTSAARSQAELATAAWASKVTRTLRYKEPVTDKEIEQWVGKKTQDDVLDTLMASPGFIKTVFDFNLYFIGNQQSDLFSDGNTPSLEATRYSHPLASAYNLSKNGDYFSLFSNHLGVLTTKVSPPTRSLIFVLNFDAPGFETYLYEEGQGYIVENLHQSSKVSDNQVRTLFKEFVLSTYQRSIELAKVEDEDKGCRYLEAAVRKSSIAGILGFSDLIQRELFRLSFNNCSLDVMESDREVLVKGFEATAEFPTQSVGDEFPDNLFILNEHIDLEKTKLFGYRFFVDHNNSSTNFNRSRGAAVLSTYFCDDLTPINVAAPESHAQDIHASDPGCRACHYKLDPISGMFRHHGIRGTDFSEITPEDRDRFKRLVGIEQGDGDVFLFDDLLSLEGGEVQDYFNWWQDHDIRTGYVTSTTRTDLNRYGDELDDLASIIAEAPEVKRCLVKRMAEYFVGNDQTFDSAWLDSLQGTLTSHTNSSEGFKAVVKRIMKSNVIQEIDPIPGQCYDFVSEQGEDRPPCLVASVLEKNCTTCHGSASASAGLDLSTWKTLGESTMGFEHLQAGIQVDRCETFSRIINRISTSDANLQMPLAMHMEPQDRETLYLWAQDQLDRCQP